MKIYPKQSSWSNTSSSIGIHFSWYFLSLIVNVAISFIKSPIYTDLFSPNEFGLYSLVLISFTIFSMFLLNFSSSAIWRFHIKAKQENSIEKLYSTIISLILISGFFLITASLFISTFAEKLILKKLIVFGAFYFITNELVNIIIIHLKIEGKSARYSIITSIQLLISFGILLFLTFVLHQGIESFFSSIILSNIIILIWLTIKFRSYRIFIFPRIDKSFFSMIIEYSKLALIVDFVFYIFKNIDRYLIQYFKGISETGLYNQIYNIADLTIFSIITIFFSAITPKYFNLLESKVSKDIFSKKYKNLLGLYLIIFLPVCTYLSLYSREICHILFRGEFRNYSHILPPIIFSNLFFGLLQFNAIKFRFENKRKLMYISYISSLVFNILLNIILLNLTSFEVAATVTLISYIGLFGFFYFYDLKNYLDKACLSPLMIPIIILIIQIVIHLSIKYFFKIDSILFAFIEGLIFAISYFLMTKERSINLST